MSQQSSIAAPAVGDLVGGKYRLLREIGKGGMGVVFEARHEAIDRPVALKTLRADLAGDQQLLARFQREARLAGSMGHDNICEVTDVGATEEGSLFLVMPLLKGTSLADVVRAEGTLGARRAADIICQVLDGLGAAHGAGVVHRDLKPENIFIIRLGGRDDFVKILDFGIAKELDQDARAGLTATGLVLGTPHYMAPEQARGSKELDHRVDVYAAGVILFEMLTGRKPYPGDSYNEVLAKILTEPFPRPRSLNPEIPQAMEEIVMAAMEKDPAERFASATAMRAAIESAVGREPAGSPAVATPSMATGATAFDSAAPLAAQPPRRPRAGSTRRLVLWIGAALVALAAAAVFIRYETRDDGGPLEAPAATAPEGVVPPRRPATASAPPVSSEAPAPQKPVVASPPVAREEPSAPAAAAKEKRHDDEKASKTAKRTPKDASSSGAGEAPADPKIKGRFGTSITSDYDE
jgi:eukaryotic-like serine/threonine-protein kinase